MPSPAAPTDFIVARAGIDNRYQSRLSNKAAVRLMWTNNQPGATHRIQSKVGTGRWIDLALTGDGKSACEAHNLALATKYSFQIRSEFPSGEFSTWVPIVGTIFTTGKLPVKSTEIFPPTSLAVAQNDYRGVLLTWVDGANNESAHIVNISGPGLPSNFEIPVDHLQSGALLLRIDYPLSGSTSKLQFSKTYSAMVKCRGGKQTKASNIFDTDWTQTVTFTTAAQHIAIVNLPLPANAPPVLRGEPFSFRVLTNIPATAITIVEGALPAGLALVGDTISGTTTDPDGIYDVRIKAEDALTEDAQLLRLEVETPPFKFGNLPAQVTAWRSLPFLLRLQTNTPPTSIALSAGELPAGLAFAGDTISGTATAAEGAYPMSFRAENALTSTIGDLLVTVRSAAIRVLVKPYGSPQQPQPGPDWGEVLVPLAELFRWTVSAEPVGPINVGNTVTIENAPVWLSLNGTTLIGTPDASGVSDVVIKWSNGTVTGETTLRIRVKPIHITSAAELEVKQDEPIQFALTSQPAARISTEDDLPPGIFIFSPQAGQSFLRGATHQVGDFTFRLIATYGQEEDAQDFILHVRPLIIGGSGDAGDEQPIEVRGWQGDALIEMLAYRGSGSVVHWFLSGAPSGVEIGTLTCPGGPYDASNLAVVAITGAAGAAGIFDAVITTQVCLNGIPRLYRRLARFLISGGLFLDWFHDDPTRRDLQVLLRTGEVLSHSFSGQQGLWLKRGDQIKLHVLFRDGPLSGASTSGSGSTGGGNGGGNGGGGPSGEIVVVIGSNNNTGGNDGGGNSSSASSSASYGRDVVSDGFTSLKLVIRPQVDPEEIVLLNLGGEIVAETIAGHTVFAFDFTVTSDELEAAIEREGHKTADPPASVSLACLGELTWVRPTRDTSTP